MIEQSKISQLRICDQLIEQVQKQGEIKVQLTSEDIHSIFFRQAEADESGDLPVLLPEFSVKISQGEFFLNAPYTIDTDKKLVTYIGSAINDEHGNLVEKNPIKVEPESLRERTLEAFGGQLDTPNFIKLIFEDAFKGQVNVGRMAIVDNKLDVSLSQPQTSEA